MTNTIEIYLDARRKFEPEDSLRYVICDAKEQNPLLKSHLSNERNALVGNILRSLTNMIRAIHDVEDFKKENVNADLIKSVENIFVESYMTLTYYLGSDVINLFLDDFTHIPLFDISYFVKDLEKNKQLSFDFSL